MLQLLDNYIGYIDSGNIPYFWNKRYNLLENLTPATKENIVTRLCSIKKDLLRNIETDPTLICRYLRKLRRFYI